MRSNLLNFIIYYHFCVTFPDFFIHNVLSSVRGLKVGVDAIKKDEVVIISIGCLIILFSVQKYGTCKVGLVVGPALLIWFCSLAGIGIFIIWTELNLK